MGRLAKLKRELIKESNIKLLTPIDFTISVKNCEIMIYRNKTLYTYKLEVHQTMFWIEICVTDIEITKEGNEYIGTIKYEKPVSGEIIEGKISDKDIKKILSQLGKKEITGLYNKKEKKELKLVKVE
jgi:hypothetical protein